MEKYAKFGWNICRRSTGSFIRSLVPSFVYGGLPLFQLNSRPASWKCKEKKPLIACTCTKCKHVSPIHRSPLYRNHNHRDECWDVKDIICEVYTSLCVLCVCVDLTQSCGKWIHTRFTTLVNGEWIWWIWWLSCKIRCGSILCLMNCCFIHVDNPIRVSAVECAFTTLSL